MQENNLSPLRAGLITASRAYDVMSKGRGNQLFGQMALTYAEELALERLGVPKDDYTSFAMQQGIDREPIARDMLSERLGVNIYLPGFIVHRDFPFVGCTPDGVTDEKDSERSNVEIKCPQPKAHLAHLRGKVDPKYVAQMQFQMWVTGLKRSYFVSYNPEFPENLQLAVKVYEADMDFHKELEHRCIALEEVIQGILIELL